MSRWARFFYWVLRWIAPEIERGWARQYANQKHRAEQALKRIQDLERQLEEAQAEAEAERQERQKAEARHAEAEHKIAIEQKNKRNAQAAFDRLKKRRQSA